MSRVRWRPVLALAAAVSLFAAGGLWSVYRPWAANWGATAQEVTLSMPGDSILSDPNFNATRAVTIDATPAEI